MKFVRFALISVFFICQPLYGESLSGSLGIGVLDDELGIRLDPSVSLSGNQWSFGLGREIWITADDASFRDEQWNEWGEWLALIRYATYETSWGEASNFEVALGALAHKQLGFGVVVDHVISDINIDQRYLGMQVNVKAGFLSAHVFTDNLADPSWVGGRLGVDLFDKPILGMSLAHDSNGFVSIQDNEMTTRDALTIVSVDISATKEWFNQHVKGTIYSEGVKIFNLGVGLHVGFVGVLNFDELLLWGQGDASYGDKNYIPGWMGPLYLSAHHEPKVALITGKPWSAMAHIGLSWEGIGSLEASFRERSQRDQRWMLRLESSSLYWLQYACWVMANDFSGAISSGAIEVRAQMPYDFFLLAQGGKFYNESLDSIWMGSLNLGYDL